MRKKNACDEFDTYAGTDKEKALDAAKSDWNHLTNREKQNNFVEVREYDLPDDIDLDDRYELVNALCDCCGYDRVIEFDYDFSRKLGVEFHASDLSLLEFSERLGVPVETFETWLEGIRVPDEFKQEEAALRKAEEIVEEIENEE